MKWLVLLLIAWAMPVSAQSTTFRWIPGQEIVLAADMREGLSIAFEPGERIARISVDDDDAFGVEVQADRESVTLRPASPESRVQLDVFTDRRFYRFRLAASGPNAVSSAVLQVDAAPAPAPVALEAAPPQIWSYRVSGDPAVQPADITDDGIRTTIRYADDQALPAVFAIGPTGEEEVVNGHMRGDAFVIDRVHRELVFRIDRSMARAQRNREPERPE